MAAFSAQRDATAARLANGLTFQCSNHRVKYILAAPEAVPKQRQIGYGQSSKDVSSPEGFRGSDLFVLCATYKVLQGPKHVKVVFTLLLWNKSRTVNTPCIS